MKNQKDYLLLVFVKPTPFTICCYVEILLKKQKKSSKHFKEISKEQKKWSNNTNVKRRKIYYKYLYRTKLDKACVIIVFFFFLFCVTFRKTDYQKIYHHDKKPLFCVYYSFLWSIPNIPLSKFKHLCLGIYKHNINI